MLRQDISEKMDTRRALRVPPNPPRQQDALPARALFHRCASRRNGRLPPSIKSKIDSHLREVRFVNSILPVSRWNFELATFDIGLPGSTAFAAS